MSWSRLWTKKSARVKQSKQSDKQRVPLVLGATSNLEKSANMKGTSRVDAIICKTHAVGGISKEKPYPYEKSLKNCKFCSSFLRSYHRPHHTQQRKEMTMNTKTKNTSKLVGLLSSILRKACLLVLYC